MSTVDPNQIAAAVVTDLSKQFLKGLFTGIPNAVSQNFTKYFSNLEDSLSRMNKTCSTVRTIINKDRPVDLKSIYVKAKYICNKDVLTDDDLIQNARDGQRVIVSGFGGIGKTVFCKYMWLSVFDNPHGKIPVFFELRNLNDITNVDLLSYLRLSLTVGDKVIPEDAFVGMLNTGRFIFILDAFDEVPDNVRIEVQKQILDLSSRFQECGFVVSSRADDRFASWHEFHQYHVQKFDKEQTREVIEKIDFDRQIKKEFLSEILEKRYADYEEFFGTPLLTLLMLMTYVQIKHIPESPHIFYRYAFQTLYTLHDASKQGFQRKRHVSMTEAQFINIFSLFCLVTYIDMDHSFKKEEIIDILDKVKMRSEVEFVSDDFLKECLESVNLLYKEGDVYSFTHRSFQEYFSAYAASHYFMDSYSDLLYKIPKRPTDSVIRMVYLINPSLFEQLFLLPEYKKIHPRILAVLKIRDIAGFLTAIEYTEIYGFRKYKQRVDLAALSALYDADIYGFLNVVFMANGIGVSVVGTGMFGAATLSGKDLSSYVNRMCSGMGVRDGGFVLFEIDYRKSTAKISNDHQIFGYDKSKKPTRKKTRILNSEEFDELSSVFMSDKVMESIKSDIVKLKKLCDGSVKRSADIKKSGIDILNL